MASVFHHFCILVLFILHALSYCSVEATPTPISVAPSQYWDGDDGSWSSFAVQVGSPPQDVRVLISSSGSALWVVLPAGCIVTDPSDCPKSRGFTFYQNESSTWIEKGLFTLLLAAEEPLGGYEDDNSDVGIDNITLGWQGSQGPSLSQQLVAGIATKDFYIGLLGLTNRPYNISSFNNEFSSPLVALKNNSQIPSLSWSYTAGASYLENSYGSLVLGGYDAALFASDVLSVGTSADDTRDLVVNILSITSGEQALLPSAIPAYIDSTVSHIWLPIEACQQFERAFSLELDNVTQLYLVNDSLHNSLLSQNANITFELGPIEGTAQNGSQSTVNVTLPYASFDLKATYPFIGEDTGNSSASSRYFPLRQAANSTQYTLGRTFLQEAYLTVDYERGNFSISPVVFSGTSNLVAILPVGYSPANGLGAGAIAGIVVGVVVILALAAIAAWFFLRKRRRAINAKKRADDAAAALSAAPMTDAKDSPLMGYKQELPADSAIQPKELESPNARTLSPTPSELAGSPKQPSELGSDRITSWDSRTTATIHELPAEDVGAAELPSSRLSVQGLGLVRLQDGG
ncbi:hypothetical protein MMC17_007562 [Xylographa soralifera]|nr:hypothetical protein [Xylographa soralifera]